LINGWYIFFLIVAGILLIRLHTALWTSLFRFRRQGDQTHYATTGDGWNVALQRFVPSQKRFLEPIFICHGLGVNRCNFDPADDRSLPLILRDLGFEVWTVDLRAAGLSTQPRLFSKFHWNFDFDDYLRYDIAASIRYIRRLCDNQKVFWVGHSMGGMLGYAWMGLNPDHGIKGLVAISSPVCLRRSPWLRRINLLLRILALSPKVYFRSVARFFCPLIGLYPSLTMGFVFYGRGTERPLIRRCAVNVCENVPGTLMRQFSHWVGTDRFCSRDEAVNYFENLKNITEPVFVATAEKDRLAAPAACAPAYEHIPSEDKQFRVFGTDRGDDFDFGHGDIVVGRKAASVVFPEVIDWIKRRAIKN
jgi:pimeloyl-ACP methyl ester carboxylesterase